VLYFQSIADRRMGGVAVRNLKLFQSLCGPDPLKSVVIVTNMWGLLHDQKIGERREQELKADPDFFGPMIHQGARFERHYDSSESAQRILSLLVGDKHKRDPLAIQSEMVDHGRRLDQTTAAAELTRDFDAMIENIKNRIKKEERLMEDETGRERKARIVAIKGMRKKIKELEERKVNIQKSKGSIWLHMAFLRWVKSMF
jgi:hypothetical protein